MRRTIHPPILILLSYEKNNVPEGGILEYKFFSCRFSFNFTIFPCDLSGVGWIGYYYARVDGMGMG